MGFYICYHGSFWSNTVSSIKTIATVPIFLAYLKDFLQTAPIIMQIPRRMKDNSAKGSNNLAVVLFINNANIIAMQMSVPNT